MMVCLKADGDDSDTDTKPQSVAATTKKCCLAEVLVPTVSENFTSGGKHVVIVMDALREFSRGPLQWALDHAIQSGYVVTLLGVMPWLPLPASSKTWLDVWTFDVLGDLSALKGRSEWEYWKSDHKYQKIRSIIELCEQKGVVLYMKVATGHPLRLVVLEQTTNLHATLVVLDRHLRKNRAFYAERLQSSVVIMNSDGGVDMLKVQSAIDNGDTATSLGESPATLPPTPQLILSEHLSQLLKKDNQ